jgi:succinate-semialdehyde dehydrogenase/glutarate-semialdehyde dehydrogenase
MSSFDAFERALRRMNTHNTFEEIQRALGALPQGPVVGGKPLDGDGVIAVVDPATEEVITEIADGTVAEATAAVGVAQQSQAVWAEISPRSRSETLRRAFDLMTQRAEALARLIVLENGKALPDARSEVAYAAEFFRWYAEEAVRLSGVVEHAPPGRTRSWSCVSRSASPSSSRPGTSRLPWPPARSGPRSRQGARSSSSPPPRRR